MNHDRVTRLVSGHRAQYPKTKYRLVRPTRVRPKTLRTLPIDIGQVPRLERDELAYRGRVPGR